MASLRRFNTTRWPPTPLTAFLAGIGTLAVSQAVWSYLTGNNSKRRKMKKAIPSYLEIMYLHPKEIGIGEEIKSTPRADGFRMPAEWEPHSRVWLLFPYRTDNWKDGAEPAQRAYASVANAIAAHGNEQVTVGVRTDDWTKARALLDPEVRVVELTSDDAWVRDTGPTVVVKFDGDTVELRGVDWEFNAYGGIYSPWDLDALVARKILEVENIRRYKAPFVLEGGSIHVDGEGTCLTNEECLLNPNRNPGLSKDEIEERLKEYLGVEKVIWLEHGVYGDEDTNGHIDNMACFKGPGEVILHWTDDQTDPQYPRSLSAYNKLTRETDAKGRQIRVHKMPQPDPMYYTHEDAAGLTKGTTDPREVGHRLAASYVNYYVANEAVIVPQYGAPQDDEALEVFRMLYSDRKVVGVYTKDIILGGGNIHCITQQIPISEPDAFF